MSASTPTAARVLTVIAIVVALQLVYVFFFVVPGHDPQPNGLRLAVSGTPSQIALVGKQTAPTLPGAELVRYDSPDAARAAITDRDAYGAFTFDAGQEQVVTASAASFTVSSLLTQTAAQAKLPPPRDVAKLTSGDPRGVVLNLLIVPLVVTGLLGAQLAVQVLGTARVPHRIPTMALAASLSAVVITTLIGPAVGGLPGPFVAEAAILALAVFGLLSIGGGLVRLLGPAGLGVGFTVFLMLGNPASGAASAPELLPTPWSQLGHVLTPGAAANALRSVAYFDGAALATPLTALVVLAAVGIALETVADRRAVATADHQHTEGQPTNTDADRPNVPTRRRG